MTRYRPARRLVAACWALAAAAVLSPAPAGAQQFTMKFSTQTLNDAQHEFMKVYKTELEQATNGRIQVGVYPASQLGGQQRQTEQLRLGAIEAAIGPGELFAGADARFGGFALAGLFNDTAHARRVVLVPEVRKALADIAQSRGLVLLGINAYDMQTMVFKTPVNSLADLSGRRMRVLATESEQAMIRALGASPVPMSLPEVLPALQQGTLDGATAVLGVYVAFRYYDVTPNLLDTHLWPIISISFVSRAFYSRLPPDLQKTVMDTGAKVETEINKWQINRLKTEMDTWKSKGGKVATLSPSEQEEARRRATAAIQPILDKDASLKQFYNLVKTSADKLK
jgi:TRAP-type C4-dicarboxylate transport system substrate-binding protein